MDKSSLIDMVSWYERTDLIMAANINGITTMSIYVSVVAAYLVAGFIAGKKLSGPQLWITSCLFVAFSLILTAQTYSFFGVAIVYISERNVLVSSIMQTIVGVSQIVGIVAALSFMRYSRKRDIRKAGI
jgi:hypothetical protein